MDTQWKTIVCQRLVGGLNDGKCVSIFSKQGSNLKAETDAEALEECCLLAYSLWLTQPIFLQNQDLNSRGGTTYNDLDPLTPINN